MLLGLNYKIIIIIICLIGGGLLLAYGFISKKTDKVLLYLKRCKEQTKAEIYGFDDRQTIQRKQKEYNHYEKYTRTKTKTITYTTPVLRFRAKDNKEYKVIYIRPVEKKLSIGEKINISYNPENPYEVFIHGDKRMRVSSTQSMETGLLLLLVAIIMIFI